MGQTQGVRGKRGVRHCWRQQVSRAPRQGERSRRARLRRHHKREPRWRGVKRSQSVAGHGEIVPDCDQRHRPAVVKHGDGRVDVLQEWDHEGADGRPWAPRCWRRSSVAMAAALHQNPPASCTLPEGSECLLRAAARTGSQHCVVKARRYRTAAAPRSSSSSGDSVGSCTGSTAVGASQTDPETPGMRPASTTYRCVQLCLSVLGAQLQRRRLTSGAGGSGGGSCVCPWPVLAARASSSRSPASREPDWEGGWGARASAQALRPNPNGRGRAIYTFRMVWGPAQTEPKWQPRQPGLPVAGCLTLLPHRECAARAVSGSSQAPGSASSDHGSAGGCF